MQGAEMEDEGSVLKYMTKSEIEEQRSSLLIMTQRLVKGLIIVFYVLFTSNFCNVRTCVFAIHFFTEIF